MKQILLFICFILCQNTFVLAQKLKMKPLQELINKEDPGWPIVTGWIKEAKNKVEILPKTAARADSNLLYTQVTTRSPMGAVIYETGGILIDNGWLRILGWVHQNWIEALQNGIKASRLKSMESLLVLCLLPMMPSVVSSQSMVVDLEKTWVNYTIFRPII
jgi:Protein of unknown function DUF2625